jgi:hypothetical protein
MHLCKKLVGCKGEISQGYRVIGETKDGRWGMLLPDTSEEWSQEQAEERTREWERQQQLARAERVASEMPAAERDRHYRWVLNQLELHPEDRRDLIRRGYTDEQIQRAGHKSVEKWQKLPRNLPLNLPGVNSRGDRLLAHSPGYLCPIVDVNGLIVGMQVRKRHLASDDNQRYYFLSQNSSIRISDQVPLAVFEPVERKEDYYGLVEGVGAKPFLACDRLGVPIIGATGGNWASSSVHLQNSLQKLGAKSGDKVVLLADGGSPKNPSVLGQYKRALVELTKQGYQPLIGWWGQTNKTDCDIDELDDYSSIQHLTPDEFWAIAVEQGGAKPETKQDAPISRDQWEVSFGFGKRLRNRIKQTLEGFKGFGKPPAPQPIVKEAPDKTFQDANQRLQIWQDAVKAGYKYILDKSPPGGGKSWTAGNARPAAFSVEKLWYLANNHRNPTTGVIEKNYVDLPVRHNGLKIDDTRKTPNGNPFLIHPKKGETPNTKGNCPKNDLFQEFRAKNLNVEASDSSPICQTCKLAYLCKSGTGKKYSASFRGDRRKALAADRIRSHADSLPDPKDFDYLNSGILWDEIGIQLKPMKQVSVTLADFDQTWAELETKAPELHEELKPFRLALRPLLTGESKQPYHGWDDASIRALLPEEPEDLNSAIKLVGIIERLEEILRPDLTFLKNQAETIAAPERQKLGISKAQQAVANRHFRHQAHQEFSEAFQKLALNWLVPLLKVWSCGRGAIRCERGALTIFTSSDRHAAVAKAAKFNIFMDATITRDNLALLLGIAPEEIYVVEQEVPAHNNLKIVQVTGMGKLGKDRSESLNSRVAAVKAGLKEQYPGIILGDWKCQSQEGDAEWFVNLRGSNEFQDAPALAVFGVPYQNIGHLQALYQTLTGEFAPLDKENPHEGLQRFINDHVQAEIEQAVGRLRSPLRPDEQLTFYFVGDYDLSFLGLPVEQVDAFKVSPEAGTPTQLTMWKILETTHLLESQGAKITQNAIASAADISQPLISKIASQFGGWQYFKKLLLSLYSSPNSTSNNFDALTDEERWFAQTYFPLLLDEPPEVALQGVSQLIQVYGTSTFLRVLAATTFKTQAKLLSLLIQHLLPGSWQEEFMAIKT